MTGATSVNLLLRDDREDSWLIPTSADDTVPLREAGVRRLLPASVVRYVERTREPLHIADALHDDRFRRDPYFTGLDRCALLAISITIRGGLRAMLLLENRMIRSAFSTERLEGIMLIASQLTVSLDNALLYASLENQVTERTQQLAAANQRLEQLSITDPLTGLANRRRLEEALDAVWHAAQLQESPVGLAMIDIDPLQAVQRPLRACRRRRVPPKSRHLPHGQHRRQPPRRPLRRRGIRHRHARHRHQHRQPAGPTPLRGGQGAG